MQHKLLTTTLTHSRRRACEQSTEGLRVPSEGTDHEPIPTSGLQKAVRHCSISLAAQLAAKAASGPEAAAGAAGVAGSSAAQAHQAQHAWPYTKDCCEGTVFSSS